MTIGTEGIIVGAGIGLVGKVAYDLLINRVNSKQKEAKVCPFHQDLFAKTDKLITTNAEGKVILEGIRDGIRESNRLLVELLREKKD